MLCLWQLLYWSLQVKSGWKIQYNAKIGKTKYFNFYLWKKKNPYIPKNNIYFKIEKKKKIFEIFFFFENHNFFYRTGETKYFFFGLSNISIHGLVSIWPQPTSWINGDKYIRCFYGFAWLHPNHIHIHPAYIQIFFFGSRCIRHAKYRYYQLQTKYIVILVITNALLSKLEQSQDSYGRPYSMYVGKTLRAQG